MAVFSLVFGARLACAVGSESSSSKCTRLDAFDVFDEDGLFFCNAEAGGVWLTDSACIERLGREVAEAEGRAGFAETEAGVAETEGRAAVAETEGRAAAAETEGRAAVAEAAGREDAGEAAGRAAVAEAAGREDAGNAEAAGRVAVAEAAWRAAWVR